MILTRNVIELAFYFDFHANIQILYVYPVPESSDKFINYDISGLKHDNGAMTCTSGN